VSATSQLLSKLSAVTMVTDTIAHVGDRNGNRRRFCIAENFLF
jgi:dTDP-D-glucose 4,6-dehydratase